MQPLFNGVPLVRVACMGPTTGRWVCGRAQAWVYMWNRLKWADYCCWCAHRVHRRTAEQQSGAPFALSGRENCIMSFFACRTRLGGIKSFSIDRYRLHILFMNTSCASLNGTVTRRGRNRPSVKGKTGGARSGPCIAAAPHHHRQAVCCFDWSNYQVTGQATCSQC